MNTVFDMIHRQILQKLLDALRDTPVVYLQGPRQSGKSTLVQEIASNHYPAHYTTLDRSAVLAAAQNDPEGFVRGLARPVIIDEAQRAPGLALAIKVAVDEDRRPGQFLLTGSAGALALPRLAESLAGRMEILTLWPFSQSELAGAQDTFIDRLFHSTFPIFPTTSAAEHELVRRIIVGGFPEAQARTAPARRRAWFTSYVDAILQRDIRDLANIERLSEIPQLLALVASRAAQLLNFADLASTLMVPQTTLKRYISLMETTFLVRMLPAWFTNIGKRFSKAPKLLMADTGLMTSLLGLDADRLTENRVLLGHLVENFVALELLKQTGWSRRACKLFHYRTRTGVEVDLLLEDASGNVVGIEVKCAASLTKRDLWGLNSLREIAGSRFVRGLILYNGVDVVSFGNDIFAVPLSQLWEKFS